jgi:hypothetical protein
VVLVIGLVTAASAQEAVRQSMAGAEAAEARRRAAATPGYYDLKLGPTAWKFDMGLGVDYNNNVQYVESNPESDVIFRPQINTWLVWPVSERNSISLALGAGYSAYVLNPGLSRFFITPDSDLSFDLYAGDFWINLHDRFSITENTYQDPTVVGTGDYSLLENALGMTTVWDLNKAILRFNYDHVNYNVLRGTQNRPDAESEVSSLFAGYAPKPGILLGPEVGGSLLHYTGGTTLYNDASQWNIGALYETQVSEYVHFRGSGGYTVYSPEPGQVSSVASDYSGFYALLVLTHRVNRFLDYSLNGGRTITSEYQGGTVDLYNVSLQANWRILRKMSLGTGFVYNHGKQLPPFPEIFDQYGPRIALSRPLSSKLSGSLAYQCYWRDSNQPGRNYFVSIVSLDFRYAF